MRNLAWLGAKPSEPPPPALSMHAMVEGWLDGFREAARAVRRLGGPSAGGEDYAAELGDDYAISDALSRVRRALLAAETAANDVGGGTSITASCGLAT